MYNGSVINCSPTIVMQAGTAITAGPYTAVAVSEGSVVSATASTVPFGLTLAEAEDAIAAGEDVTVQIKDCGKWKAGAAFAAGALLTSDANGCAVEATAGKFALAVALEAATAANQVVNVQIVKAGYIPAAE